MPLPDRRRMRPKLRYVCYQHLCHDISTQAASARTAMWSTRLEYPGYRRDAHTDELLDTHTPEPTAPVQNMFDDGVREWEESPDCARFRALFDDALLQGTSNIVAFACGTMPAKDPTPASVAQHAMVLTMLDILKTRRRNGDEEQPEIRCYAQDPAYTNADKEVLQGAGITVVEDPQGFLEADDNSVVVSISPNVPIRQMIADMARPAVLIWDRVVGEFEDAECCTDPESARVWDMMDTHYDEASACLGPSNQFHEVSVYIRRETSRRVDGAGLS